MAVRERDGLLASVKARGHITPKEIGAADSCENLGAVQILEIGGQEGNEKGEGVVVAALEIVAMSELEPR
jgi:hypothetical protein